MQYTEGFHVSEDRRHRSGMRSEACDVYERQLVERVGRMPARTCGAVRTALK